MNKKENATRKRSVHIDDTDLESDFESIEDADRFAAQCPCVSVNTWEKFFAIAVRVSSGNWVFRGHESSAWRLQSSLEREHDKYRKYNETCNSVSAHAKGSSIQLIDRFDFDAHDLSMDETPESERFAITRFRELMRKATLGLSDIECLATMQHYGAKTRLLDFSTSILVALFFAFENRITQKRRSIYAVNIEMINNGLCGLVESNMPIVQSEHTLRLLANKNIRGEPIGLSEGILPVWAIGNNPRLVAQSGMFLLPLTHEGFEPNLRKSLGLKSGWENGIQVSCKKFLEQYSSRMKIFKINFNVNMERTAWQILDICNVSSCQMFPDIVGIAKGVRYKKATIF